MPDRDPPAPAPRADHTGSWRPNPADLPPAIDASPTVRTGGSGTRSTDPAARGPGGGSALGASGPGPGLSGSAAAGVGSATGRERAPAAPLPLPEPGEELGGFRLERAIGAGGMGAVYLALDRALDRHVALKILPPEQARDPESVQRFYQEARAAARLDDENIARVYSIAGDRGYHFIAFEFVEGTTLREQVDARGPLPPAEVVSLTLQVAGGLVHAAERGLVHRDIKPSNLIVTPQGRVKLVDMGLARHFERGGHDTGLTQSGMTLGTFDYISPEQARDPRDVDVRSDLYSLGCTMFHALTGRPPFPDGTVLQKLLQHQEEPAPDVRAGHPEIPVALGALVRKLMEKDRDRRYQTPQQLTRDLQALATELGLTPTSTWRLVPPGAVTEAAVATVAPAAWERHLIWAVPTLGLLLVGLALAWWAGAPPGPRGALESPTGRRDASAPTVVTAGPATATGAESGVLAQTGPVVLPAPDPTGAGRRDPAAREIPISSREDLRAALAAAPSGATLVLTDDGPYVIRSGSAAGRIEPGRPGRDLTLRSADTARPVLVMDQPVGLATVDATLLTFRGGRVRVEGLELRLEPGDRSGPNVAILAEDADLELVRCRFRTAPRAGAGTDAAATALLVRSTGQAADRTERPLPVRLQACHFDGGQIGIRARGPTDLALADCTFGPDQPALYFDNANAELPIRSFLTLRNARILAAGGTPALRLVNTAARCDVDGSVIAAAGTVAATLVATDVPGSLDWRGRDNLYGGIGTFLMPTGASAATATPVRDFVRWGSGAGSALRETRSLAARGRVWASADPTALLAAADPAPAFRLADPTDSAPETGPRRSLNERLLGPNGVIASVLESARNRRARANDPAASALALAATPTLTPPGDPPQPSPVATDTIPGPVRAPEAPDASPAAPVSRRPDPVEPAPVTTPTETEVMPRDDSEMEPMTQMPMPMPASDGSAAGTRPRPTPLVGGGSGGSGPVGEARTRTGAEPGDRTPRRPGDEERPVRSGAGEGREPGESGAGTGLLAADGGGAGVTTEPGRPGADRPARTAEEFQEAVRRLGSRGGTIRLAAEADLSLRPVDLPRGGPWVIKAEARGPRPRLRFRPSNETGLGPNDLAVLFQIAPGSALELDGVDLSLERPLNVTAGRLGLFALGAGAELILTRCTVTQPDPILNESRIRIAVVHVAADTGPGGGGEPDASPATVRLSECLFRCGRDGFDVAPGRRLDLSLTQCAVLTGGSLVHGHAQRRGLAVEPIRLSLREVTARTLGGLVRLDSDLEAPDLPAAEVRVVDSLLATSPEGGPLVLVQGQEGLNALRDRVTWEGRGVFYHQIETYRRDQSVGSAASPSDWRRAAWEQAFGGDDASRHGDARFATAWDPDRSIWSFGLDDLRLDPDSPALDSGADLNRIPGPGPVKR